MTWNLTFTNCWEPWEGQPNVKVRPVNLEVSDNSDLEEDEEPVIKFRPAHERRRQKDSEVADEVPGHNDVRKETTTDRKLHKKKKRHARSDESDDHKSSEEISQNSYKRKKKHKYYSESGDSDASYHSSKKKHKKKSKHKKDSKSHRSRSPDKEKEKRKHEEKMRSDRKRSRTPSPTTRYLPNKVFIEDVPAGTPGWRLDRAKDLNNWAYKSIYVHNIARYFSKASRKLLYCSKDVEVLPQAGGGGRSRGGGGFQQQRPGGEPASLGAYSSIIAGSNHGIAGEKTPYDPLGVYDAGTHKWLQDFKKSSQKTRLWKKLK